MRSKLFIFNKINNIFFVFLKHKSMIFRKENIGYKTIKILFLLAKHNLFVKNVIAQLKWWKLTIMFDTLLNSNVGNLVHFVLKLYFTRTQLFVHWKPSNVRNANTWLSHHFKSFDISNRHVWKHFMAVDIFHGLWTLLGDDSLERTIHNRTLFWTRIFTIFYWSVRTKLLEFSSKKC